jgi:hypothetical protein
VDPNRVLLVVCVTLFLVVGINAAIYVSLTRKNTVGQIELLRRAAHRARDPWGPENTDLKELSRLVSELKDSEGESIASETNDR